MHENAQSLRNKSLAKETVMDPTYELDIRLRDSHPAEGQRVSVHDGNTLEPSRDKPC